MSLAMPKFSSLSLLLYLFVAAVAVFLFHELFVILPLILMLTLYTHEYNTLTHSHTHTHAHTRTLSRFQANEFSKAAAKAHFRLSFDDQSGCYFGRLPRSVDSLSLSLSLSFSHSFSFSFCLTHSLFLISSQRRKRTEVKGKKFQ